MNRTMHNPEMGLNKIGGINKINSHKEIEHNIYLIFFYLLFTIRLSGDKIIKFDAI